MKNVFLFLFLVFSSGVNAQKTTFFNKQIKNKKGIQLVLKQVISDSRCPEGVNCIWAGECEIQIAIYKKQKLVSTENIVLSPKTYQENIAWFQHYYPKQKVKEVNLMPYPKNEVVVNPATYFVKIRFD